MRDTYKRYSVHEIRKIHPEEKKEYDRTKLWLNFVIRPLSFFITKLFIDCKITPNQTTIASILSGVLGSLLIATGNYIIAIIGTIFINLFTVLDAVDGNIARTLKIKSPQGEFLDDVAGYVVIAFLYPCIGMGLFLDNLNTLQSFLYIPLFGAFKAYFIMLGSLAGSLSILHLNMTIQYNRLIKLKQKKKKILEENKELHQDLNDQLEPSLVIRIVRFTRKSIIPNFISSNGFLYPLLFLATILRILHIFLVFYSMLHILYFFTYYYRNAIDLGTNT